MKGGGNATGAKRSFSSSSSSAPRQGNTAKKYSSSAATSNSGGGNRPKTGQPKRGGSAAPSSGSRKPGGGGGGKRPNTMGADQLHKKLRETAELNRDARNELVLRMNKIWNDLRSGETSAEKQQELCAELAQALRGKVFSFAQRPDTSRVLQTLFKLAADGKVRMMILDELAGHLVELCKGKYSSFLVLSLLRNAKEDKERSKLAVEIRSSVRQLGAHSHGARVVNYCLCAPDVISPAEKKRFYEHLYGSAIMAASAATSSASTSYALKNYFPSAAAGADADAEEAEQKKKTAQLQPLKKLLLKICEKGLLRFPFAQVLLWELLQNLSTREDVLLFLPVVTEASMVIVGTWEGAQCVAKVMRASDSKDRKKIVKEWKSHVLDLCTHQFGWYVVAVFLSEMDDTKFSSRTIFDELFDANNDQQQVRDMLAQDEGFGRKVLLSVLLGQQPKLALAKKQQQQQEGDNAAGGFACLHCDKEGADDDHVAKEHQAGGVARDHALAKRVRAYFEHYDELFPEPRDALSTSKKDAAARNQELVDELSQALFRLLGEQSDVDQVRALLQQRRSTDLVRELFSRTVSSGVAGSDELRALALERVAEAGATLLDDAKAHLTIKRMIKDETESAVASSSFASVFASKIDCKALLNPSQAGKLNRVCFVLDALCEHPVTGKPLCKQIKPLLAKLPAASKDESGVLALKARVS